MAKVKYYKSKESYQNQMGYFKLNFNQIRKDKSTTKFTKINTQNYKSLLDEMKDYAENEYICAGLNSYERECVIIDSDDDTHGAKSLEKLNKVGLVPHFQKIKSNNGHSQTFFFINKITLGGAGFYNSKFWEIDNFEIHNKWKRLTKMINFLYAGDICYTGYNCQNPFFSNENSHTVAYKDYNERYDFDQLYEHCLNEFSAVRDIDEFLKKMRKKALLNKSSEKKIEQAEKIIIKFKEQSLLNKSFNNIQISNNLAEKILDIAIEAEEHSINERIFIHCTKVAKGFHICNKLSWDNYDFICKTAYKRFVEKDFADGYSCQELINRIREDIKQLIFKEMNNLNHFEKIGYVDYQRQKSLETRRNHKNEKIELIKSILSFNNIQISNKSDYALAKFIKSELHISHNIEISIMTARRYVKEIKENEKKSLSNNSFNNIQMNKIQDLVNQALEDYEEIKENEKKSLSNNSFNNIQMNNIQKDWFSYLKFCRENKQKPMIYELWLRNN